MLARFTDQARQCVIHAGILALEARRRTLDPDLLVLALAETRPFALASFVSTPEALRRLVDTGRDHELLAALGIDAPEIRRRARLHAPGQWRLERTRLLRVTLHGPLGSIQLAARTRKVIEVATWKPGPVTGERLLWGLLADSANGAARLLATTGTNLESLVTEASIPTRRRAAS